MAETLKTGKVRRTIDLDADAVKWYENQYGVGRLSWLCDELLKAFIAAHKQTPQQLMEIGALELKKMIISGEVEPGVSYAPAEESPSDGA